MCSEGKKQSLQWVLDFSAVLVCWKFWRSFGDPQAPILRTAEEQTGQENPS